MGSASFASAVIIIDQNAGNFDGDHNILFNDSPMPDGFIVQGVTQSGLLLDFFGAGESLHVNGGQARVEATDGIGYTKLTYQLDDPNAAFKTFITNLNPLNGGTSVAWYGTLFNGSEVFLGNFALGAGQNFFRFNTDDNGWIQTLRFVATGDVANGDIQDARQNRIGGEGFVNNEVVPEPASMAMVGFGAMAAWSARRKLKAKK